MDLLPELVVDLQASSARGAAAMSLAMCLAHHPELDIDRVTSGVPPTSDVNALLNVVSDYDSRIAQGSAMTNSMTRWYFLPTSLLKRSFIRNVRRRCDLPDPTTEASIPGLAPRRPGRASQKTVQRLRVKRVMTMTYLLHLKLKKRAKLNQMFRVVPLRPRANEKLIAVARNNNASFWPYRGFVI
jgi:hypothetical protein